MEDCPSTLVLTRGNHSCGSWPDRMWEQQTTSSNRMTHLSSVVSGPPVCGQLDKLVLIVGLHQVRTVSRRSGECYRQTRKLCSFFHFFIFPFSSHFSFVSWCFFRCHAKKWRTPEQNLLSGSGQKIEDRRLGDCLCANFASSVGLCFRIHVLLLLLLRSVVPFIFLHFFTSFVSFHFSPFLPILSFFSFFHFFYDQDLGREDVKIRGRKRKAAGYRRRLGCCPAGSTRHTSHHETAKCRWPQ